MSMQGTWCDGLIMQAVADELNLRIVIAESHEHFRHFNIIRAVSSAQTPTDIYWGHIDEYHYVSTCHILKFQVYFGQLKNIKLSRIKTNIRGKT